MSNSLIKKVEISASTFFYIRNKKSVKKTNDKKNGLNGKKSKKMLKNRGKLRQNIQKVLQKVTTLIYLVDGGEQVWYYLLCIKQKNMKKEIQINEGNV